MRFRELVDASASVARTRSRLDKIAILSALFSPVVYVRPELVVEIAFNEVQESTHYPGGVTLRFARVKGYRPDRNPGEADTIDAVRALM